jgi:dTDP-4-amino-4,6-dideoxygalactose transaminase
MEKGAEIFLADAALYLEMFGIITISWQWLLQAMAIQNSSRENASRAESQFMEGKLFTCRYYFAYELPKIEALAKKRGLKVIYDAAHAFGCTRDGVMVGNFGDCEVYSFHATKFLNSFEGGAIVTNNDELAAQIRLMRNFGFSGYDNVVTLGVNGKMSEACAAMGLTSLESVNKFISINKRNHEAYRRHLSKIPGISLLERKDGGDNNYQYIVIEVEESLYGKSRDQLLEKLHFHNIIARKYFWPGCHNMQPYRSDQFYAELVLKNTEDIAKKVLVLPTGETLDTDIINKICNIVSAFTGT